MDLSKLFLGYKLNLALFKRYLPFFIGVIIASAMYNSYNIKLSKKIRKAGSLKYHILKQEEKNLFQKSILANEKSNSEILKSISQNDLQLEDSKTAPILIIDHTNEKK